MASNSQEPLTIAVIGATGNQGQGVVRALLAKTAPTFHVRAVTRDSTSASAHRLLEAFPAAAKDGRLSLATGNIYDTASLVSAFDGVYGVFAMIEDIHPRGQINAESDMDHILTAGRAIIDAAKSSDITHLVFSSLPNISHASHGRFTKVFHFDHKNTVEQWMLAEISAAVTILHPGYFTSNFNAPWYCRRTSDGAAIRLCAPLPADKLGDWVDANYDIGVFAAQVFAVGPAVTKSKIYPVVAPNTTLNEMAQVFQRVTGEKMVVDPISIDEWGKMIAARVGQGFEEDSRQMMQWSAVAPDDKICYGTKEPGEDRSWEDLGVKASTFEEYLRRSGWTGPASV